MLLNLTCPNLSLSRWINPRTPYPVRYLKFERSFLANHSSNFIKFTASLPGLG
ncbi:hypothetical protein CAMRE0001_1753 [Campylobacter rectus RM3267]|uniref:Uncharacterized protein n=1 Tax=Campylobacter rectus RM3267 TaxID=553218 RepID=B9CYD6_CAMRE|nr:hypothetical protein CAMRE0001_1753 [Campylobacter rectus RM3267]